MTTSMQEMPGPRGPAHGKDTHSYTSRASHQSPAHSGGLTLQSLHTWSFCTVSPILGTWPPMSAHQSGHLPGLPQLSGLEVRVGVVSRSRGHTV